MNLLSSIFTSFIIVTVFWGLTLFQGNIANAIQTQSISESASNTLDKINRTAVTKAPKITTIEPVHIAGIKQRIELNDIQKLWQQFNSQSELHNTLKDQPKKVFVLYNALSKNYQQADVIIGYETNELTRVENPYSIDISHHSVLLPAKKYSELQLANAWEKINYSKVINYVLEVHSLNTVGETTSIQLSVSYK